MLGNVVFCILLVFCGVNVALDDLPGWMATVGSWLPLTHGIEAARLLADGSRWGEVGGLVLRELGIGAALHGLRTGSPALLRGREQAKGQPRPDLTAVAGDDSRAAG